MLNFNLTRQSLRSHHFRWMIASVPAILSIGAVTLRSLIPGSVYVTVMIAVAIAAVSGSMLIFLFMGIYVAARPQRMPLNRNRNED
jgi:hypothetical protein